MQVLMQVLMQMRMQVHAEDTNICTPTNHANTRSCTRTPCPAGAHDAHARACVQVFMRCSCGQVLKCSCVHLPSVCVLACGLVRVVGERGLLARAWRFGAERGVLRVEQGILRIA
jgi:hypothetical protein